MFRSGLGRLGVNNPGGCIGHAAQARVFPDPGQARLSEQQGELMRPMLDKVLHAAGDGGAQRPGSAAVPAGGHPPRPVKSGHRFAALADGQLAAELSALARLRPACHDGLGRGFTLKRSLKPQARQIHAEGVWSPSGALIMNSNYGR